MKTLSRQEKYIQSYILLGICLTLPIIFSFYEDFFIDNREYCFTTANSYFSRLESLVNHPENKYISPDIISSGDSFSLSLVIISLLKPFSSDFCLSTNILRYFCRFLPIAASCLISYRVFHWKYNNKMVAFILPTIFIQQAFLSFQFGPANFNYPFLLSEVNSTIDINGLLTTAFSLFLYPFLFYETRSDFRIIILLIGGIINPISSFFLSAINLFSNIARFVKNKEVKYQRLCEPFYTLLSYIISRWIWLNVFHINSLNNLKIIEGANYNKTYLDFIDQVDVHRNAYRETFYNLILRINPSISSLLGTKNQTSIYLSYLGYILFILALIFIFKSIYRYTVSLKKDRTSFKLLLNNYLRIVLPCLYSLVLFLLVDLYFKIAPREFIDSQLPLFVSYNRFYISRMITILFGLLHYLTSLHIIFCLCFNIIGMINFLFRIKPYRFEFK